LLEVDIGREGVGKAGFLHDDEGDAIGQAPGFVLPRLIQVDGSREQRLVKLYYVITSFV
jgi:hypothetical protein